MLIVEQKTNTKLRAKFIHLQNRFKAQKNKTLSKTDPIHTEKQMENFQSTISKKAPKHLKETEVQTCQEILQ